MGLYNGLKCTLCGKPFTEKDAVVVCPDCGAPQHKECYQKWGRCVLQDQHGTDNQYKPPKEKVKVEGKSVQGNTGWTDAQGHKSCPNCGVPNPPEGLFCYVCGSSLKDAPRGSSAGDPSQRQQPGPFGFMGGIDNIYGGVNPETKIHGVSAKELALFVGQNSAYYLPRFEKIDKGEKFNINFGAFIFDSLYFIYRKMYGIGAVLFIISMALSIPSLLFYIEDFAEVMSLPRVFNEQFLSMMIDLSNITFLLDIAYRFFCALFANRIYLHYAINKITKIKQQYPVEADYTLKIAQAGSVSTKAIAIVFAIPLILILVFYFAIVFIL